MFNNILDAIASGKFHVEMNDLTKGTKMNDLERQLEQLTKERDRFKAELAAERRHSEEQINRLESMHHSLRLDLERMTNERNRMWQLAEALAGLKKDRTGKHKCK